MWQKILLAVLRKAVVTILEAEVPKLVKKLKEADENQVAQQ